MARKYTLFVDESGESGIKTVRTNNAGGASPYMTLGAVLIPNSLASTHRECLSEIAKKLGKSSLHCQNLNHQQKVYWARTVSSLRFLGFGVISMKETLGSYRETISSSSHLYYNKCAQYLLEKVGLFMEQKNIQAKDLEIIFEQGNFDYSALSSLISKCQRNPIRGDTKYLRNIDVSGISQKPKAEESLLQLSDLVAHALFKCVDKTKGNFDIPEPRYLQEIQSKFFYSPETGQVEGYGIKAVHNLQQLKLDTDIRSILANIKVSVGSAN